ncbi:hypothetical protein JW916_09845 [Candidatus Sumerlaeota bacterium]|nr:hypothetical protein [Candidatus Sumerlaeota bacterium]
MYTVPRVLGHGDYRVYRCSPYHYGYYRVIPWYSTYYYPIYTYAPEAVYYAPGFSWGFQVGDDEVYFAYGYGSGIAFEDAARVYSWYPYGGHQRLYVSDRIPQGYDRYVGVDSSYVVR